MRTSLPNADYKNMLAYDVFSSILDFVDASTLENLNIATRFNRSLHALVLREQWHRVVVLVELGGGLPRGLSDRSLQILQNALRVWKFGDEPIHAVPASFIRRLEVLESHRTCNDNDSKSGLRLDSEQVTQCQTSIVSLLSSCTSLQEVCFQRRGDQVDIENIIRHVGRTVKTLALRYPGNHLWSSQPDWSRLSLLPSLRTLTIGDFEESDVDQFVKAMSVLKNLENLTIVTLTEEQHDSGDWPFRTLFNKLYSLGDGPCSITHNLPPHLRRLALCEGSFSRSWLEMVKRSDCMERICLPYLEELVIDMSFMSYITTLLDWWDLPRLRRLSLQSISLAERRQGPSFLDYREEVWPGWLGDGGNFTSWGYAPALLLDERLAPLLLRSAPFLDQIMLLDALRMDLQWSRRSWTSDFTVTDLVLGSRINSVHSAHPSASVQDLVHNEGYDQMKKHCVNCRQIIDQNQLYLSLQRLRIEQVDFYEDLIAFIFEGLTFSNLRVLMLYPWAKDPRNSAESTYYASLDDFLEGRLARRILSLSFPELCVLIIGAFKFYITPGSENPQQHVQKISGGPSSLHIQYLNKVLRYPRSKADSNRHLDERDWVFLTDLPPHPLEQDGWARRCARDPETGTPGDEANFLTSFEEMPLATKYRNYMVLHPQRLAARDRSRTLPAFSMYGKPLGNMHKMASWNQNSVIRCAREGIGRTMPVERVSRRSS